MRHLMLVCIFGVSALAAQAQEADPIHGVYEGAFTSGWKMHLSAEVVAIAEHDEKRMYRANFFITPEGEETIRVEVPKILDDPKSVTLQGAIEGEFTVSTQLEDGTLTGAFKGDDVTAEFSLKRVKKESPTLGKPAPEGAVVLLDGTNLDAWLRHPEKWCLTGDGAMEVCGSNLKTKEQFGSAEYHIEFRTPFMPNARGQARGNSGVYVQGRYEVQVLDSFGELPAWDYCSGIYKVAVPSKNASYPPGEWQTYDINYHAPKFDADGNKTTNARITVVHNGETVHDNIELPHPTPGGLDDKEAPTGALMLQDHNDNVRYRNIWLKPLD